MTRQSKPLFSSNPGWRWFILTTVLIGAAMSALDVSIENIALPTLRKYYHIPLSLDEWVAMAYMLTLTIFLPLFGRLADMFGRTKMYNLGFIIFTFGSALCGIAPTIEFMIISRVIQAIGGGLLQANSVAIITQSFPREELGRAIGIQGAVQAISMAIGPFLGGLLISLNLFGTQWRSIFYVNVPIGIFGTAAAYYILPRDKKIKAREKFDFVGSFTFAGALLFLVLALNEGRKLGWESRTIILYFLLFAVLFTIFVINELKYRYPMIDFQLFKKYDFSAGNITGFFSYYVLFGVLFIMPFYLENVANFSPFSAGAMLTPIPITMSLVAPLAGVLSDKYGPAIMTSSGMFLCTIACACLIFCGTSPDTIFLVSSFTVLGLGMGLFTPPNNSSVMSSVPEERLGSAGGILNMMRASGRVFGIDISGLIVTTTSAAYLHRIGFRDSTSSGIPRLLRENAFMRGYVLVLITFTALNLLSALLSLTKKGRTRMAVEHFLSE
ncbi:MAG: MFS transporter [Candidatus Kryptoniota bacterium]